MSKPSAGGKHETLSGRVHGSVGWSNNDVKAPEMHPHRWRGVGEPSVGEGVCSEEMAELVVDVWRGNGHERQEGETRHESRHANTKHRKRPPLCHAAQGAPHGR